MCDGGSSVCLGEVANGRHSVAVFGDLAVISAATARHRDSAEVAFLDGVESPRSRATIAPAPDDSLLSKVAAQVATVQADHLSQSGATLLEYELAPAVVSAVLSGEADAALVDLEFAREGMAEHEGKLALVGPRVELDSGIGVGVREDDGDLKDKLDKAIADMKEDGSLNALIEKWFGPEAEKF